MGLSVIPGGDLSSVTTGPAVDALCTTTGASQRIGFGAVVQAAITERFAVNVSLLTRRVGYQMNSDIYEGTDLTSTTADERKHTVTNEDTRARIFDLPVLVRYYGKDRHQPGARWFVEGGGSIRRVSSIKSSIDTTINSGTTSCCDTNPVKPEQRSVRGLVGGIGVHFKDDFGIRIIPEVRYTRWMGDTFKSFSTATQRNQIEAMISLTF
jgi:hypothetical protein